MHCVLGYLNRRKVNRTWRNPQALRAMHRAWSCKRLGSWGIVCRWSHTGIAGLLFFSFHEWNSRVTCSSYKNQTSISGRVFSKCVECLGDFPAACFISCFCCPITSALIWRKKGAMPWTSKLPSSYLKQFQEYYHQILSTFWYGIIFMCKYNTFGLRGPNNTFQWVQEEKKQ